MENIQIRNIHIKKYNGLENLDLNFFYKILNNTDYKIIIGKKIVYNDDKVILKINKDDFSKELKKIEKTKKFSKGCEL